MSDVNATLLAQFDHVATAPPRKLRMAPSPAPAGDALLSRLELLALQGAPEPGKLRKLMLASAKRRLRHGWTVEARPRGARWTQPPARPVTFGPVVVGRVVNGFAYLGGAE